MNNGLMAFVAFFTFSSLLVCPSNFAAGVALDGPAAAAAARQADAAWAAAADAPSVGAWMSFYAADAIVLLPNDRLASGMEPVRQTVTRLLALPHLSIAWRPIDAQVAQSGDLVFLIGAYELRFDDSHGVPVSDRGRRLEIWKLQSDGGWKCSVDTWNLDAHTAAPAPSPASAQGASAAAASAAPAPSPASAQAASAAAASAAPLAQGESAPPAAALNAGPPPPARGAATKYGDMPYNYEQAIRKYYSEHLKHPESVQYREITQPQPGYTTEITGGLLMREKREYGWTVKATINAKDSRDSYVGFKSYTFLFRGENIVDARLPLPADETN